MNTPIELIANPRLAADMGLLVLHPEDNVGTALGTVPAGSTVSFSGGEVLCTDEIPGGHKVALRTIEADEPVRKYGQIIGFAGRPIRQGEHVHVHNVAYREFDRAGHAGTAPRTT
ncbi:MAG TPA: UxaA family hydrolase, partial [Arthrobacter sp.]